MQAKILISVTCTLFILLSGKVYPGHAAMNTFKFSGKFPPQVIQRITDGEIRDLIVLFDDTGVESPRSPAGRSLRKMRLKQVKLNALQQLPPGKFRTLRDYSQLPLSHLEFASLEALQALDTIPGVQAVFENTPLHLHLAESIPLLRRPSTFDYGFTGENTSVGIVDTGVDFTRSAFGSCTAPGVPADCRVVANVDIAPEDHTPDAHGHGSNVAGIVVGTADKTGVIALDVFDGLSSSDVYVLGAINWAIENQTTYHIAALNISLGNGVEYATACSNRFTNPYVSAAQSATAAGIILVASAGNENYTNGLSRPACTPDIVSVGAVYDNNIGGRQWSVCTDSTTQADQVPCFSNSASYLDILAPGALITAGGSTMGGTSQAAPHVAGALAIVKSAFPGLSTSDAVYRLVLTGIPVTDPKSGVTTPRLDLYAALEPYTYDEIPMLPIWGILAFGGLIAASAGRTLRKKNVRA
ncbi:MAG: S8 family serine peptidase [Proteobacteria bacterium]|nr:S8 family serine peptidase [Pseudomonadota bacterium]MBU1736865.1 S8 family serine peptidase [Pseudomonadota bacterium]